MGPYAPLPRCPITSLTDRYHRKNRYGSSHSVG